MILLSHPTGNQNSRQAGLAFSEEGMLQSFVTAAHFDVGNPFLRCLPSRVRVNLRRRDFSDVAYSSRIQSVAMLRETVRLAAPRLGLRRLAARETGWACVDKVYHAVDRAVAGCIERSDALDAVYAYEDGALESFRAAQRRGIARIYELPIGYWRAHRRLCEEEALLQPKWAHTWHADVDSAQKLARKDEEVALATRIIVPSRFVAESLREYPGELPPVSIVPYGCPTPIRADTRRWYGGGPLRVLYVGGLSQRKGLSYLLDAIAALGDSVSLTLIGSGHVPSNRFAAHRLLRSVPHQQVLEEMRQHDVFVFPTLFEGYSLAVAEALSQGLVVITTANSGVADIIEDGRQGWIVPLRDSVTVTERLEQLAGNPPMVATMGNAALVLAASHSWKSYRVALRNTLRQ